MRLVDDGSAMRRKCYCGQPYRDDGLCVFRCPPQLARPARRAAAVERVLRDTRESSAAGQVVTEMRQTIERVLDDRPPSPRAIQRRAQRAAAARARRRHSR